MMTEQLFEYWNVDQETIAARVVDLVGPCDILLGGSLADDLGGLRSDVDIYCFQSGPPKHREHFQSVRCEQATLEIYTVDIQTAPRMTGDLRPLILEPHPIPPHKWPLLSAHGIRILYALFRDRILRQETNAAEQLRTKVGADLLHICVALRSTSVAVSLAEDAASLTAPDETWCALYCARLAVESALDAALAASGMPHPNPKWRVPLASRAELAGLSIPPVSELLTGLFPKSSPPEDAVTHCLSTAKSCLTAVESDGYLMLFPQVREASREIERSCAVWHARSSAL
jgi:hypothetical protein